ncbi:hypothetical protein BC826DRAFT_1109869 [Russula brevipes]|nr:hypothetical protein BC826DRAFT_1109869 [Russula brevipes]
MARVAVIDITSILFGLTCEAFFHGCYTILFAASVYLIVKRSRDRSSVNKHILIINSFLYLSCTAHFALELVSFYTLMGYEGPQLSREETAVLTAADVLIIVTDFIGELILIYRCWLLWSRNHWVIILPIFTAIMSLGDSRDNFPKPPLTGLRSVTVCVGIALHYFPLIYPTRDGTPPSVLLSRIGFSLPLCTNVLVTTLIIARIWYLSPRKTHDVLGGRFPTGTGRAAIDIVVESGMLYLVVQLIFVVLFAIGHPAQGIVAAIAVQIYGIAPVLLIIRVARGLSKMPSEFIFCPAGPGSKHASPQVHIRFSIAAYSSDVGQRLAASIPASVSRISTEPGVESLGSSISSIGNITSV